MRLSNGRLDVKHIDDFVEEINRLCPSLQTAAEKLQGNRQDADSQFAFKPFLAAFAHHLAEMYECEDTDRLPEIFTAINHLYAEGNEQVREGVATSFIDGLKIKYPGYTTDTAQLCDYLSCEVRFASAWFNSSEHVYDLVNTLFRLCPAFREADEGLDRWIYEEQLPLYTILGDFARHLIGLLERGETERFPLIFIEVERLLHVGDDYTQGAVVVGLLEDLQNHNLYETGNPEQFRPYLGPKSAQAWDELNQFWEEVIAHKQAGLLQPLETIDSKNTSAEKLVEILAGVREAIEKFRKKNA